MDSPPAKPRTEINRTYYTKHREKIIANLMRKVDCECGCIISYANLKKHQLSGNHFKRLAGH